MKRLFLALLGYATLSSHGESLPQRYADYGELILAQFVSAPFPHPQRAEGHTYKNSPYPATIHYTDNTVAMFIPRGFRESDKIDFVVHFHGWKNNVAGVLQRYKLIEQLVDSGRNAVLVVPQGPRDAPDSFGGKLEEPEGFHRFMDEVLATLRLKSALKREHFGIGQIVLSGHSGGYQVISSIVACGGLADHIREVWLFDALYARTDRFLSWFDTQQGRLVNIYTEHGGTKAETERLMTLLRQRNTRFYSGKESTNTVGHLKQDKLIFLLTDLGHNDVLDKHQTFRDFLQTSCLRER